MRDAFREIPAAFVVFGATFLGCTDNASQEPAGAASTEGEHGHDEGGERGEHDRDGEGHHGHGEEGEESGTELALADRYDNVRNGARLILAYDADSNSFQGTAENTTEKTLERVRVEVHLSNGKELGPTTPGDLEPGEKRDVTLKAESNDFDGWSAHPEVGNEEHGHGAVGEHAKRERGKHDREEGASTKKETRTDGSMQKSVS